MYGDLVGKEKGRGEVARLPKKKCCVSTTRCKRCPLRMLKEGTLPPGYTVKKRRLVKVEVRGAEAGTKVAKGGKKAGKVGKKVAKAA